MRLLYLTDTHFRGTTPQNRLDKLPDTLKNKLEEVVRLAAELKVDYVLHGGDFFDSPTPSLELMGDYLELFRQFTCPVYVISGNHDLFASNLNSLPRTLLGFLSRLGFLNLLLPGEKVYLKKHDIILQLTGQPYHYDIDRRDRLLDYAVKKDNADFAVHMVHGMLFDQADFPGQDITLIDQISSTQADITLCGHNHLGFGVIEKEDKFFVNPGALVRLSNHKQEISRPIGIVLIDLESYKPVCKIIRLKSALPGEQVLTREKIVAKTELNLKLACFVQEIKKTSDFEKINARRIIEDISKKDEIDEEVRREALRRIALAEERLRK